MSEFLRFLGCDPLRYWLPAWTCFALWLLASLLPFDPRGSLSRRLASPLNFALLLLLAMAAFRWPTLLYKPVNPDEPQFLAGALTMVARRDFWFPDGMTSGPLVMLPLTLPALVGHPIDFVSGRVIALLLGWGTTLCTGTVLRAVHGERLARFLLLPLGTFMVLVDFWDFTAYSSEWLPLFLCAAATALGLTAFDANGIVASRRRLAACGAVLGALPFSKLQALPIGAALGVGILFVIAVGPVRARRRDDFLALLGGVAGSLVVLLAWLAASGRGSDFIAAYLRHNLYYAGSRAVPWRESAREIAYLSGFSWGFASFHIAGLLVLAAGLGVIRDLAGHRRRLAIVAGLMLLSSYYAILAPGRSYPHYLLLLTFPLALAGSLLFGFFLQPGRLRPVIRIAALIAFPVVSVGIQAIERVAGPEDSLPHLVPVVSARTPVVSAINRLKQRGDLLAVWGWRPELYVETQLPQATREAHTERQINANPQQAYFRAHFLADVQAARPAFVVDAVGPEGFLYQDAAQSGLGSFPDLAAYVAANYRLAGKNDAYRLYVRNDRLPAGPH